MTGRLARLPLLLLGVILAVALVEVVLRLRPVPAIEIHRRAQLREENPVFFEYDADLGWRGRPGAHGSFSGWEFTHDVRLNSRGFRDGETGPSKPPGRFRIVLLGDSITWGHGVEGTERYGELLSEALRGHGVTAEVVNLAVSGYGTDQELLLWRRIGRRSCADLVLLGLYENDLRENAVDRQGSTPKPYFRLSPEGELALQNVPVPRVPDSPPAEPRQGIRSWLRRHLRLWAALAYVRESVRGGGAPVARPPEVPPGGIDLTAALVRRLATEVSDTGAVPAVVVLPDLTFSSATLQALSASGVRAALDLTPWFREASGHGVPLFYRLDGAHWTARAHRLAADAIARWILTAGLLPSSPRPCAVDPR